MARWIAPVLVLLFWASHAAAPRAARSDDLLGQSDVKEFRALIKAHQYRKLRVRLAAIEPKLASRTPQLRAAFKALQRDLSLARERWLTERVATSLFEDLQSGIRLKVANVKLGAGQVLAWARARLEAETFARIAKRLKPFDDASVAELRAAWERRKRSAWRKLAIPRGMTSADIRADAAWWKKSALAERRERVLLAFIASGDLFEIRGEPFWSACPACKGTGLETRRLASGTTLSYLCSHCGGAQRFAALGYR